MDVVRLQQQARQTLQGTASDAQSADMLDAVTVDAYKGGTRPHTDHHQMFDVRGMAGSQSVGQKLVGLACRQPIQRTVDKGAAYTRQHHLLYVGQRNAVVVDIFAECPKQRGHRVGSRDEHGRLDEPPFQSHYLGGTTTHIYSNYDCHIFLRL